MSDDDDNIVSFPSTRELNGEPRQRGVLPSGVLKDALSIADTMKACLVISLLDDGTIYAADTQEHFGDTLLIMERFKQTMMGHYEDHLTSDHPPGTSA